jgi:hypothetical protein
LFGESLPVWREVVVGAGSQPISKWGLAFTLLGLGSDPAPGDPALSRHCLQESVALFRELDDKWGIGIALLNMSRHSYMGGDYERARAISEEGLTTVREFGEPWSVWHALNNTARIATFQRDYTGGSAYYGESLALARRLGHSLSAAASLVGLATIWGSQGKPERAGHLVGAAQAILDRAHAPMLPMDKMEYDHNISMARAGLDDASWEEACAKGRKLTLEEAYAYSTQAEDES